MRLSLRARLVASVAALLLVGLLLSGGATFGALQDWRSRQVDDLLAAASDRIATALAPGAAGPRPALATAVGGAEPLWRTLAARGDVPSFFQLRSIDGQVLDTVAFGAAPRLDEPFVDPGPGAARVTATEGPRAGDEAEPWRVRAVRLAAPTVPEGEIVLLVGQRTTASAELIARTLAVMVVTSVAVLAGLVLVSALVVRRGLRPLVRIADTATAIGDGDLTRRVHDTSARTEVGRLGAALNAMLARLEEAFAARARSEERLRRFVADASHELRTPLATVRGYAELFRRGAHRRPDDLADAMHRIEVEAGRMSELVDELLLLARLDQGRPLDREPVDLGAIAADAVDAARAREPDRPWTVSVHGDVRANGDDARLRQVLANLLANVRAHTPAAAPADVLVRGEPSAVVVEVTDSGPGIPESERELVFERFHQADPASVGTPRNGDVRGSGLGLAIVAAVAEAHGGRARATAADGGGARMTVTLPRDRSDR